MLETILPHVGLFVLGLFGLAAHFLKKSLKNEFEGVAFKEYMVVNWRQSVLAGIGYIVLFAALVASNTLNVASVIGAGYLADSAFNKFSVDSDSD